MKSKIFRKLYQMVIGAGLRIILGMAAVLVGIAGSQAVAAAQLSFGSATHLTLPAQASELVTGDFNSDGNVDIVASFTTGTYPDLNSYFAIFLGDGTGSFTGPTISSKISDCWGYGGTTADFNNDGNLDVAFVFGGSASGCFGAYGTSHLGNGTGGFYPPISFFAGGSVGDVEAGDFNGDGIIDIVTNYVDANSILVSRGIGNGTFSSLTYINVGGRGPHDIEVNDFNGDGKLDLAAAVGNIDRIKVYLGNGVWGFNISADISLPVPTCITSGDFDTDGKVDLAVCSRPASSAGQVSLLFGDGSGNFTPPTSLSAGSYPAGIKLGDFDGDGNLDLAVVNSGQGTVTVLLGDGSRNFSAPISFAVGVNTGDRLRVADFDGNGMLDLAVSSAQGVSVLLNTTVIDTTPPVIVPTVTPAPNAAGWNNTNVTVSWSVSDLESGIASSTGCDMATLTTETAGTTLTCSATNDAGLSSSAAVTVKIDKKPPTVSCSVNPNSLWPPNHKMVTVTASVIVSDSLSGTAGFTLTSATSNEPDEGLGDGDFPNDIQGFAIGTPDTSGLLRAERSGLGTGRIYTLIYTGMDVAGNSASCNLTVKVPHDQRK